MLNVIMLTNIIFRDFCNAECCNAACHIFFVYSYTECCHAG